MPFIRKGLKQGKRNQGQLTHLRRGSQRERLNTKRLPRGFREWKEVSSLVRGRRGETCYNVLLEGEERMKGLKETI